MRTSVIKVRTLKLERASQSHLFLLITLIVSMFTYLWSPLDYPKIGYTDGTTMRRAMHLLTGHGLQDPSYAYDHPFFAQFFLGGVLWVLGYPNSVHPTAENDIIHSVTMLWFIPKVLIGIMAVIDTFLIYKISERRYNTKVAFIASMFFAVIPIQFLRPMYFESIQLPFFLSSILFAINTSDTIRNNRSLNKSMVLLSGIFLGFAILTKIPVFTMIPLVGSLIYSNNRSPKTLGLWFVPVILIPLIWPSYALLAGEFDKWWSGIYWQINRQEITDLSFIERTKQNTLSNAIIKDFFKMPLLIVISLAGLALSAIKKDFFLVLWVIPFLVFLYFIGFVRDFHLIPLIPALCVSSAILLVTVSQKIRYRKIRELLPLTIFASIAIFGTVNNIDLLANNHNNDAFAMSALVVRYLQENRNDNITVISTNDYGWIPRYVFHTGSEYMIPELGVEETPHNKKVLIVVNPSLNNTLNGKDAVGEHLREIYDEHSKTGTAIVEIGDNKIVLPQPWPSVMEEVNGINLIDNQHTWTAQGNTTILRDDGLLSLVVGTNKTDQVSGGMHLSAKLENITKSPLLLYIEYASESKIFKGDAKYYFKIKDDDDMKTYFMLNLPTTSGKLTHNLVILPREIFESPVNFKFSVDTKSPGEHVLSLKKASLITRIP